MTDWPTPEERRKKGVEDIMFAVRQADDATNWAEFARWVQFAELSLDLFRFDYARRMLNRRPKTIAMRARELARLCSRWGDEIDDPEQTLERVEELESLISTLKIRVARAATKRQAHATDATFLRAALINTIEAVVRFSRREWKSTLPTDPCARWTVLADEVIRLYGENLDPARVPLMRRKRHAIATAVEASSNLGGRNKVARIHKSEAIVEVCAALGLPAPDYDSIVKGNKRKPRAKK